MAFRKRTAVIRCCIRFHNYCIGAKLDLSEKFRDANGLIEVVPGLANLSVVFSDDGVPVENVVRDCM